jgi:hypothetical protein
MEVSVGLRRPSDPGDGCTDIGEEGGATADLLPGAAASGGSAGRHERGWRRT